MLPKYGPALGRALQSAKSLWVDKRPLPTNLWATDKVTTVKTSGGDIMYIPKKASENEVIRKALEAYLELQMTDIRTFVESDFFGKWYRFRNWYIAGSMIQQANKAPWFHWGNKVPKGFYDYLVLFWDSIVPDGYRELDPQSINCPNGGASTGLTLTKNGFIYEPETRDFWAIIQESFAYTRHLLLLWAPPDWSHVLREDYVNVKLEKLCVDGPVIRTESGPNKVRWAKNHPKDLYLQERTYMKPLQDSFSYDLHYLGKASHATKFAKRFSTHKGKPIVATHGDDWIAACNNGLFLSGDWSNFDHHVSGLQIVLSYKALRDVLEARGSLTEELDSLLRSHAYLASKGRVIWPWGRDGIKSASIRRKIGGVRSGRGDFVPHNNAINTAGLRCAFERGFKGWPHFTKFAEEKLNWVAKPSAQFASRDGFIACRTVFERERAWKPIPCASSVVRNWVRAKYDPSEFPQNSRVMQLIRIREINKTLYYLPESEYQSLMAAIVEAAQAAGVADPYGSEWTDSDLSREAQRYHIEDSTEKFKYDSDTGGKYNMLSYLRS